MQAALARDLARVKGKANKAPYKRVLDRDSEARVERAFSIIDKNHNWALDKFEVKRGVTIIL